MKRVLVLFLTFVMLYLIGSFVLTKERIYKWSANNENNFNSNFSEFDTTCINQLELSQFELVLPANVLSHFDSLYELVYDMNYEKYDLENTWQKGELSYLNNVFVVKIKLHGNTPYRHEVGSFRSLSIKSETPINGSKRFNLIIYERINVNADRIRSLSNAFGLIYQRDELIQLKLNDFGNHLYYFEQPINKHFLTNKGWVNFKLLEQKSPILNQTISLKELTLAINSKVDSEISDKEMARKIKKAYTSFNTCIDNSDSISIHNYFDLNYISSFQLARATAGFINHGFSPENLIFALDTGTFLFYPILHRDNYFGRLSPAHYNCWAPYFYPDVDEFEFEILKLISGNSVIKTSVNKIIDESQIDLPTLFHELDAIDIKHSAILKPSRIFGVDWFENHETRENSALLKELFK